MADPRSGFYQRVLGGLLEEGLLHRDMSVLVAAGGSADRDVLLALGFSNVTISNLDEREAGAGLEPFGWRFEDAESLSLEDASVDLVISNGVIDLVPDKDAVFAELFRVLRPGGRLQLADVTIQRPVSEEGRRNIDLWTG